MSSVSGAMRWQEDDATRAQEQAADTRGAPARATGLERRVGFTEGARALLGATASRAPLSTSGAAPGRALSRTAPLLAGRCEAPGVGVTAPATVATVATPHVRGARQDTWRALRLLWVPAALYVALNAGDVVSTYLGLRHGLDEGNPLMAALLTREGFDALIVYKVVVTLVVLAGLWVLSAWSDRAARVALLICNSLVALVVVLNLAQFALLGR